MERAFSETYLTKGHTVRPYVHTHLSHDAHAVFLTTNPGAPERAVLFVCAYYKFNKILLCALSRSSTRAWRNVERDPRPRQRSARESPSSRRLAIVTRECAVSVKR